MFENAKEKRAMREANKIVSLKEDMDVVSWERVLEIGKLLQEEDGRERCAALGSELVEVAHSNLSLYSRFGIEPAPSAHVMPSGIEVLEGGLAEAALEEHLAAQAEGLEDGAAGEGSTAREISVPVHPEQLFSKTRSIESLRSEQSWDELLGSNADEEIRQPEAPADEPVDEPSDEPETAPTLLDSTGTSDSEDAESVQSPVQASEESPAEFAGQQRVASEPQHAGARFARFRTLYESRDHSLCVFEDENGHLVAVDSSKLA